MHRTLGKPLGALLLRILPLFLALAGTLQAQDFDILVRNGRVLDGTGNPEFQADVGIRGNEIVALGDLDGASADRVIDATGFYVVPGFIDMHSHADDALTSDSVEARRAHNLVAQGITTVVVGPDGRNALWPISAEMAAYEQPGTAMNVVPMVGHGEVRELVMGDDYERPATPEEIERMRALVRQGMEDGAWGLGAGPEYRPGRFSTTEELIALAKVVADYGGFYYAHQRSQSPMPKWQTPSIVDGWPLTGTDGIMETIRIGREAGIRVVGTHIKTKGRRMWGQSVKDVIRIDRARKEGVQVYLDQYPYETFGGGPIGIIPPWVMAEPGTDRSGGLDDPAWREDDVFADYQANLRRNLADPETRPLALKDIEYLIELNGGPDRLVIVYSPSDLDLVGKTLAEVAAARSNTPVEMVIEFAMNGDEDLRHGVLFRPFAAHEFDVETYMKQPYTATSTDGGVSLETRPGQHPRYYGAFPRKIAYYVREEGVITLPFAIRSSTGLAAQIVGLPARGYLREGYAADIVVFDYERIQDRATVLEPDRYPEGIEYVMVNGEFTVDGGRLTGALPGIVLDRRVIRGRRPPTTMEGGP